MTTTKTKTPDKPKSSAPVRKVEAAAASHRKAREAALTARDRLDKAMLDAKTSGATYRDIAQAAGVSTAWVQTALERRGYVTNQDT